MTKIGLALVMVFSMAQSTAWAGTNPARQYEEQRGTTPPVDGVWHVYDRQGNLLREEHYKSYRLSGAMKTFYVSGAVKEILNYDDGYKEGPTKTFFENGAIQSEATYLHNKFDGPGRRYYPSGELESEYTYDHGKLVGEKKIYHKSGAVKQVMTYKQGILHGISMAYGEDGQVIRQEEYREGVLGSRKEYSADSLTSSVLIRTPNAVSPNEGNHRLPPSQSRTTSNKDELTKP